MSASVPQGRQHDSCVHLMDLDHMLTEQLLLERTTILHFLCFVKSAQMWPLELHSLFQSPLCCYSVLTRDRSLKNSRLKPPLKLRSPLKRNTEGFSHLSVTQQLQAHPTYSQGLDSAGICQTLYNGMLLV